MSQYASFLLVSASLVLVSPAASADSLFDRLDTDGDGYVTQAEIPAEQTRLFDRMLRKGDWDSDQRLSRDEFAEGMRPSTPPKPIQEEGGYARPQGNALKVLLLKLDTNQDAYLTRDEAPSKLRGAYDQLAKAADGDKDGDVAFRELVQSAGPAARVAGRTARQARWNVEEELTRLEREQGDAADRFDRQPEPRAVLNNPQRVAALFKQLDTDDDGRLKLEEVPDEARDRLGRLLRRADRDRSGDVTLREFTATAQQAGRLMQVLDRDRRSKPPNSTAPGETSMEMSIEKPMEMMAGTPEETHATGATGQSLVRRMVARMDVDRDGVLSRAEVSGQLAQRFDAADGNNDGALDRTELQRVAQQLQKRLDRSNKASGE